MCGLPVLRGYRGAYRGASSMGGRRVDIISLESSYIIPFPATRYHIFSSAIMSTNYLKHTQNPVPTPSKSPHLHPTTDNYPYPTGTLRCPTPGPKLPTTNLEVL